MWKKESELVALRSLRLAAYAAMKYSSMDLPFSDPVRLEVEVHLPGGGRRGDLDNFITGICDGLQACAARTPYHPSWDGWRPEVHPSRAVVLVDDDLVHEIVARKVVLPSKDDPPWYRVTVASLLEADRP